MNREEFEALLKMEGKRLEVKPVCPAQRSQKYKNKCYTWWKAIVWEPMKMSHLVISPHFAKAMGIDLNEILEDEIIDFGSLGATNHKAVKSVIKRYLKRVQQRANNRR
jgi:hypothetical protein